MRGLSGPAKSWADSALRADDDSFQRLAEVMQTALSCLCSGDYIGFLARLESFADNARRAACELLVGMKIQGDQLIMRDLKAANSVATQRLEKQLPSSGGQWKIRFKLYETLMQVGGQLARKEDEVSALRSQLRKLQNLERLRNAVVHELKPVSREALDRAFPPTADAVANHLSIVLGQLRKLGTASSAALRKNVFDAIKQEVLQRLEKLDPVQYPS